MSGWLHSGPSTSSMKRRASRSPAPDPPQKRRRKFADISLSLESNRMAKDGTMLNSANNNVVHGNVENFLSNNTIKNISSDSWHSDICRFLSPLDPEGRHSTIRDKLTKGTGQWLLSSQSFRRWRDSKGPWVLCLLGEPGTGKSSLFCHVINELRSEEKAQRGIVASVYCDYSDQQKHTARNIIGALLSQIIAHLNSENELVKELRAQCKRKHSLVTDECKGFLWDAVTAGNFDVVWLCLDALDELDSQERDRLLRELLSISQLPMVRIFFTGRPNAGVENSIQRCLVSSPATPLEYISVSPEGSVNDIRRFLEQQLREDGNPSLMDDGLRAAIFRQLAGGRSTFLLAALNIGKVLRGSTTRRREKALNDLVLNLDTYYEEMVNRIKRQGEDYGIRILHWILFAQSTLTLGELRYAVAIDPGTTDFEPSRDLPPPSLIDSTLGLVTVDQGSWYKTVRFVHFTFKEHLLRNSTSYFPRGHALLAEATLTYLSFDAIDTEDGRRRYATRGDLHAFRAYAAENWGIHARLREDDYVVGKVCSYLKSGKFNAFRLLDDIGVRHIGRHYTGLWWTSPLHAVSYFGLSTTLTHLMPCGSRPGDTLNSRGWTGDTPTLPSTQPSDIGFGRTPSVLDDTNTNPTDSSGALEMSKRLLTCAKIDMRLLNGIGQRNFDINCADRSGWTPLIVALGAGHTKVAKQLLEWKDVDVNLRVHGGVHQSERHDILFHSRTPLLIALDNSQLEIAELLLEREDINVNLSDQLGRVPLSIAVDHSHLDIVTQILRRNDISPDHLGAALCNAVFAGHVEIAKNLLEREDTNVNFQNNFHQTPLSIATLGGHLGLVTRLQRKDIDVNLLNQPGQTPLSIAPLNSHVEVAKQPFKWESINVDPPNQYRGVPLHVAISEGRLGTARPLLERNDISDPYHSTALWIAVSNGHLELVAQLLQREDIDVNLPNRFGEMPFSFALDNGRVEIAKKLLEREDISLKLPNQYGRMPLHIAISHGHLGIARQLLERDDIDVKFPDPYAPTALWIAASNGHLEIVAQLLQRKDMDVNLPNRFGQTPLSRALELGHIEIAKMLLERENINVNPLDQFGRTPLHVAISHGHLGIARQLLERNDVDVNFSDQSGRTALCLAVSNCHREIDPPLLLHKDIGVNLRHRCGRRPQSRALEIGHIEIVKMLLKREDIGVSLPDHWGHTPHSIALDNGQYEIAKQLLERMRQ